MKKARLSKESRAESAKGKGLLLHVALATGHRALLLLDVTRLALPVIGHAQPGLIALGLEGVAIRAAAVFGAFALDEFAVFIDMMTFGAILDHGLFVVRVMIEHADRTFQGAESVDLEVGVFLGKGRNAAQRDAEHDRAENNISV